MTAKKKRTRLPPPPPHTRSCSGRVAPRVRYDRVTGCYHATVSCTCGHQRKISLRAHTNYTAAYRQAHMMETKIERHRAAA